MGKVNSFVRRFLLILAFNINLFCSAIKDEQMLQTSTQAMEQKMLHLLGLNKKPNPIKNNAEENSARLFMLGLYGKMRSPYEDGRHRIEPMRHYLALNSTLIPDIHEIDANDLIISFVNQAGQLNFRGQKSDLFFYFNFTDVSSQVFVTAAELKLYKEPSKVSNESLYLIEVFRMEQGNDTENRNLEPEANLTVSEDYEGWLSIQITNTASYWNDYRTENLGLYVRVTDLKTGLNVDAAKAGIVGYYGPENQQPFMIGMFKMKDEVHVLPSLSAREAQSVSSEETKIGIYSSSRESAGKQKASQACQKQEMYVDFESLGWKSWIIAPDGYHAYYCSGECTFPFSSQMNATLHAIVQGIVHGIKPEIPTPCCAPNKLSDNQLLYKDDNGNVVYKIYKAMVVDTCGCL